MKILLFVVSTNCNLHANGNINLETDLGIEFQAFLDKVLCNCQGCQGGGYLVYLSTKIFFSLASFLLLFTRAGHQAVFNNQVRCL